MLILKMMMTLMITMMMTMMMMMMTNMMMVLMMTHLKLAGLCVKRERVKEHRTDERDVGRLAAKLLL